MGQAQVSLTRTSDAALLLRVSGPWQLRGGLPSATLVQREIEAAAPRRVTFDASALTAWDSGLLTFLVEVSQLCQQRNISTDRDSLPSGVRRLTTGEMTLRDNDADGRRNREGCEPSVDLHRADRHIDRAGARGRDGRLSTGWRAP